MLSYKPKHSPIFVCHKDVLASKVPQKIYVECKIKKRNDEIYIDKSISKKSRLK